jgi:hypothetical protein
MRKILLLTLGLVSSAAHAERLDSLKNFAGIWAPAEGGAALPSVACEKELSGGAIDFPAKHAHMNCSGYASAGSTISINQSIAAKIPTASSARSSGK